MCVTIECSCIWKTSRLMNAEDEDTVLYIEWQANGWCGYWNFSTQIGWNVPGWSSNRCLALVSS